MKAAMLAATALLAMAAAGARADAETAPEATAPAAPVQICTTTTTVVRRGDVVVSTASTTRCEDEATANSRAARAVFNAPDAAVKSVFGSGIIAGGGNGASAANVRGDWRVVDVKTQDVCLLFLTSQPAAGGFHVRNDGCKRPISQVAAWTFDNGDVLLHAGGGDVLLRLMGNRDHMAGVSDAGARFELLR